MLRFKFIILSWLMILLTCGKVSAQNLLVDDDRFESSSWIKVGPDLVADGNMLQFPYTTESYCLHQYIDGNFTQGTLFTVKANFSPNATGIKMYVAGSGFQALNSTTLPSDQTTLRVSLCRFKNGSLIEPFTVTNLRAFLGDETGYEHLSSGAFALAMEVREEFEANNWEGVNVGVVTFDQTYVVSNSNELKAALDSAKVLPHERHHIRLAPGDYSKELLSEVYLKGGDFLEQGGFIYISPHDSLNVPFVGTRLNFMGTRGVHVEGLKLVRKVNAGDAQYDSAINITRNSSFPLWPVVHVSNCEIGGLVGGSAAPNEFIRGVSVSGAEEVVIRDNLFYGSYGPVVAGSVHRIKIKGNDFRQVLKDGIIVVGNSDAFAAKYIEDPHSYVWSRLNTIRDFVDDNSDPEYASMHSDMFQLGTSGDKAGYKFLREYDVDYGERTTYHDTLNWQGRMVRLTAANQGTYLDDALPGIPIHGVVHNVISAVSANAAVALWNGNAFVEHVTAVRVGDLAPRAVLETDGFDFNVDPVPLVKSSQIEENNDASHTVRNTVLAGISQENGTVLQESGNVIAYARNSSAQTGQKYEDVFSGNFYTDQFGRMRYSFDDTVSREAFRENLYEQFTLKSGKNAGAFNPALWPLE